MYKQNDHSGNAVVILLSDHLVSAPNSHLPPFGIPAKDTPLPSLTRIRRKIEKLIERYDVFGVVGNGACLDIQKEANVQDADLAIALTDSDELNVFVCLVARTQGPYACEGNNCAKYQKWAALR